MNVFTDAGFDAIRRIVVAKIGNSSKDIMTVQNCECPLFRDAVRFERFFLVICSCGASLAYCSRKSKRFSHLKSWIWLSLRTHVKRVNQRFGLCRKSWVFSGYSGFLPQGKLTGWVEHIGNAGGRSLMRYGLIAAA